MPGACIWRPCGMMRQHADLRICTAQSHEALWSVAVAPSHAYWDRSKLDVVWTVTLAGAWGCNTDWVSLCFCSCRRSSSPTSSIPRHTSGPADVSAWAPLECSRRVPSARLRRSRPHSHEHDSIEITDAESAQSAGDHHGYANRLAVPASGWPSGSYRGGGGRASIELFDCGRVCLQQHGWCPFCAKRDDTDSVHRGRRSWSNKVGAIKRAASGKVSRSTGSAASFLPCR